LVARDLYHQVEIEPVSVQSPDIAMMRRRPFEWALGCRLERGVVGPVLNYGWTESVALEPTIRQDIAADHHGRLPRERVLGTY
jgi:hypothetical protein